MSFPGRTHPVYFAVILFLLTVLAYGAVRQLTARVAHAAERPIPATTAAERAQGDAQGQATMHVADCDADQGPGEAESILAQHPGR